MKKNKWNTMLTGTLIGTISPLFCLFCYWLFVYSFMSFIPQFFKYLSVGKILAPVLSLCVLPNLGFFFLFINKNNFKTGQGIILGTILHAILIFYLKLAT